MDKVLLHLTLSILLNVYTIYYAYFFHKIKYEGLFKNSPFVPKMPSQMIKADDDKKSGLLLAIENGSSSPIVHSPTTVPNSADVPNIFWDVNQKLHITHGSKTYPTCILFNRTRYCKSDILYDSRNNIVISSSTNPSSSFSPGHLSKSGSPLSSLEEPSECTDDEPLSDKKFCSISTQTETQCEKQYAPVVVTNTGDDETDTNNEVFNDDNERYIPEISQQEPNMQSWYTHVRKYIFNVPSNQNVNIQK